MSSIAGDLIAARSSAFAVVGSMRRIRLQSVAYQLFDLERLRTAVFPFSERELPTQSGPSTIMDFMGR